MPIPSFSRVLHLSIAYIHPQVLVKLFLVSAIPNTLNVAGRCKWSGRWELNPQSTGFKPDVYANSTTS